MNENEDECDFCGLTFLNCGHVATQTCICPGSDPLNIVLRGNCLACLFDGAIVFEDQWDSLAEVSEGVHVR